MFRRNLGEGEGLLMVEPVSSRISTSIHMLFMAFPIAAIWLDSDFKIVDMQLAKPWHLAYVPAQPAQYTLEASQELLSVIAPRDQLVFEK